MSSSLQRAFVERLDRHRGILFKVAAAYCSSPADREDLVAETIAALWRSYGRFDGRSSFATWMHRIAVNVAISFYRSETRKRRGFVAAGESVLERIPAPDAETDDRLDLVRELIGRLDPLDRALMLLYLEDYSHAEIASVLGISESNVGTKIGRIKERLKRNVAAVRI
jgi:RNA polymerase sigma factor (sigma-70 family)